MKGREEEEVGGRVKGRVERGLWWSEGEEEEVVVKERAGDRFDGSSGEVEEIRWFWVCRMG